MGFQYLYALGNESKNRHTSALGFVRLSDVRIANVNETHAKINTLNRSNLKLATQIKPAPYCDVQAIWQISE